MVRRETALASAENLRPTHPKFRASPAASLPDKSASYATGGNGGRKRNRRKNGRKRIMAENKDDVDEEGYGPDRKRRVGGTDREIGNKKSGFAKPRDSVSGGGTADASEISRVACGISTRQIRQLRNRWKRRKEKK